MSCVIPPLQLAPAVCERARLTRDQRFDGLFFTAVTSTGIFCRSVCPAPAAKAVHVRYYASAAAARAAGFRPCLRCRPEAAPLASPWPLRNGLVAGALQLIDEGWLDAAPVATLAARVGVSERQLRRVFAQTLGASPVEVAATRRLLLAKRLLDQTALPVTDIALAAGYGSVRRFNAAFRGAYHMAPRDLRRGRQIEAADGVHLRLPYREPYDFAGLLAFFALRAIPGTEQVDAQAYARCFVWDGEPGFLRVVNRPRERALDLCVSHPAARALPEVALRVRRMFDVAADPHAVAAALGHDELLAPLVQRCPGARLAGGWDGFEMAVRAILGQQISVAAARTLVGRLVARWGPSAALPGGGEAHAFPPPEALMDADVGAIGLTGKRAETVRGVARAVTEGRVDFHAGQGLDAFVNAWTALPGIGAWTAHYLAMRALGHPDAFPAADLVLRKVVGAGTPVTPRQLEQHSQAWRPWRAYATLLLWRAAT